jgi:hypothetical protein
MLHGTPPITTNFGVFPGTIPDFLNGVVGFRCDTLQDFVDAAVQAKGVHRSMVRAYGEQFLLEPVANKFQKWFEDLYKVYESAKDPNIKGFHRVELEIWHKIQLPQRTRRRLNGGLAEIMNIPIEDLDHA